MQVTLIGKDYINRLVLPQNVAGNYWISDTVENKEIKLVSIEAQDGMWFVGTKNYARIYELKEVAKQLQWVKIEDSIALKEHEVLGVQLGESKEMFLLYCAPVLETYTHLKIKDNNEITIGSGKKNQITYYSGWVSEYHAKLYKVDGKWMLDNFDTQYGVFVNGKVRHKMAKALKYGDVVYITGTGKWDGVWQIQDTMNKRFAGQHKIDILVPENIKYGQWDNVNLYVLKDKSMTDTYKSQMAPQISEEELKQQVKAKKEEFKNKKKNK